jgi:hypothetical protein
MEGFTATKSEYLHRWILVVSGKSVPRGMLVIQCLRASGMGSLTTPNFSPSPPSRDGLRSGRPLANDSSLRPFGYLENKQLLDALLSAHKLRRAFPGTPRVSKRMRDKADWTGHRQKPTCTPEISSQLLTPTEWLPGISEPAWRFACGARLSLHLTHQSRSASN